MDIIRQCYFTTLTAVSSLGVTSLLANTVSPECHYDSMTNFECSSQNYTFFSQQFYYQFDLIYIGRDNSSSNLDVVGCACDRKNCDLWCCDANASILNSKQCTLNARGIGNLKVLGNEVDIFEYTFSWHDKAWRLCDGNHPLMLEEKNRIGVAITENSIFTKSLPLPEIVVIAKCAPILGDASEDEEDNVRLARDYIYWTHALTIPFVIVTIAVYVTLPNLKNVHGMALVCLQMCLIVCDIVIMYAYSTDYTNTPKCNAISFLSYWAYMCKESWMFTMGFDLWRCFCIQLSPRRQEFGKTLKIIAVYSLFAWGIPSLIVSILWALYSQPIALEKIKRFNCRDINCCHVKLFYLEELTLYTYFESVFASLNLIFLILTFKKIRATEHEIDNRIDRLDVGITRNQQIIDHFCKFVRLFVIMNVTWIFSRISHHLQTIEGLSKLCYNLAWQTDVVLQGANGMIIFILFPFKKSIRSAFWNRVKRIWSARKTREIRTLQTISH